MASKLISELTQIGALHDEVSLPIHDVNMTFRATIKQLRMLLIPPSTIMHFACKTAPEGFLLCDGSEVSRVHYKDLFDAIGEDYGAGDGITTFNLPLADGDFIRGTTNPLEVATRSGYTTALPTTGFTGVTSSDGGHSHTRGTMEIEGTFWDMMGAASAGGTGLGSVSGVFHNNVHPGNRVHRTTGTAAGHEDGINFLASRNWTGSTSSASDHTHTMSIDGGGDLETAPQHLKLLVCIKY